MAGELTSPSRIEYLRDTVFALRELKLQEKNMPLNETGERRKPLSPDRGTTQVRIRRIGSSFVVLDAVFRLRAFYEQEPFKEPLNPNALTSFFV